MIHILHTAHCIQPYCAYDPIVHISTLYIHAHCKTSLCKKIENLYGIVQL